MDFRTVDTSDWSYHSSDGSLFSSDADLKARKNDTLRENLSIGGIPYCSCTMIAIGMSSQVQSPRSLDIKRKRNLANNIPNPLSVREPTITTRTRCPPLLDSKIKRSPIMLSFSAYR